MTATAPSPMIDDYFVSDGFAYNAAIRPVLPYDWRGAAIKRMRALRLSTYKPYIHCTPNFVLTPFSNAQAQIRMLAGTYLWGMWLNVIPWNPAGTFAISKHNIYTKVTDNATGSGPLSDWVSDQDMFIFSPINAVGVGYLNWPQLLPEPYVVTDPGLISVEFSNNGKNGETVGVQLQFMACVPCDRPQNAIDLGHCI